MTDEEYVQQAIQNVIEKRHGFPAGCGYTDAWIEHERLALTASHLKVETQIAQIRALTPGGALVNLLSQVFAVCFD